MNSISVNYDLKEQNKMTEKEFCKAYNMFYGEEIDSAKQISIHKFSGEGLFKFAKHLVGFKNKNVCPLCDGIGRRFYPNCTPPIDEECPACKVR